MNIRLHSKQIPYPAKEEPAWSRKVDRWYQLDRPAFSLTQLAWDLKEIATPPVGILLACEGASNATDQSFAAHGACSAQRFSHTLPNVRGSCILQAIDWHGPLICLQKDPSTLATALVQAPLLFPHGTSWIFSFLESAGTATLIECNNAAQHPLKFFSIADLQGDDLNRSDAATIDWLLHIEERTLHR